MATTSSNSNNLTTSTNPTSSNYSDCLVSSNSDSNNDWLREVSIEEQDKLYFTLNQATFAANFVPTVSIRSF